jgi:hypothetical protein
MAPPQLNLGMLAPVNTGISPAPHLYLGPNISVKNSTEGLNTAFLPIKTASTLTVGKGLNVNVNGNSAALSISDTGALNTNSTLTAYGDITTSSTTWTKQLRVHDDKATISDTGKLTIQDDLVIGSTFAVTKSTGNLDTSGSINADGALTIGSTTNSTGTVTIGNSDPSQYKIQLMNTGEITAHGDLQIGEAGGDKLYVNASTGNMYTRGSLQVFGNLFRVGAEKLMVDGANGDVTAQGTMKVRSGGVDRFSVNGETGDLYAKGSVKVGADMFIVNSENGNVSHQGDLNINYGKFTVASNDGSVVAHTKFTMKDGAENTTFTLDGADITMGNTGGNGKIVTSFNDYVKPDSYTNVLATDNSVSTTSATSNIVTTQAYVDKAIWEQTKRINRIVGDNDITSATFSNLFNMAQTLAGNDAVQTLSGLLDTTGEIKTSLTTVMNRAYNPVAVNCAPAVWADECPPMPIPNSVSGTTYGLDGWYFRNSKIDNGVSSKINWYVPANGANMQIDHLLNLFLNVYAVSDNSLPFITVLTQPKGNSSDLYPTFCNASLNFYFSASSPSTTSKKSYTLYTGSNEPANCYNTNKLRCFTTSARNGTNRTQNNNVGSITTVTSTTSFLNSFDNNIVSPTDKILCFVIQTASTAAEHDVNMIVNSLNVESRDTTSDDTRDKVNGTTKFMFSNGSVATNYQFNFFNRTHMDFTPIDGTKSEQYLRSYNALVGR